MREAIEAISATLHDLLGDASVVAYYGCGCDLHEDLLYHPMHVPTTRLHRFVDDSLNRSIVIPGLSDFDFRVPEGRLAIRFCHECDIHLGGDDSGLVQQLMGLPPFSDMKFEPEPGA